MFIIPRTTYLPLYSSVAKHKAKAKATPTPMPMPTEATPISIHYTHNTKPTH